MTHVGDNYPCTTGGEVQYGTVPGEVTKDCGVPAHIELKVM